MIFRGRSVIAVLAILGSLIFGCSSNPEPVPQSAHTARIRVFHGVGTYIYFGDVCDGNTYPVIHAAAGGFSYLVPNKKIGMPQTDDMPSFSFHEYAIPAEQLATIKMFWQAQNASKQWQSCGPIYMTFIPKAGQDYDTFMRFEGGVCQGIELREFVAAPNTNSKASTQPALFKEIFYKNCSH